MPIINTAAERFDGPVQQIYNGLDCCLTFEIFEELSSLFNEPPLAYNFERALQAPALDMMLRGFRVDPYERQHGIDSTRGVIIQLQERLDAMATAVWGRGLNPNSFPQLKEFFYTSMGLKEIWVSKKGVRKLSFDRETLEKLEVHLFARPTISAILELRNQRKLLQVLEEQVDPDGRMRTSFNIAGTETGRFSSSASVEGTGGNMQNITGRLRHMFVADPGYKLYALDGEQAESRETGWLCWMLFGDPSYLDACESGDLHTYAAKLIWRELPWTGNAKADRKLAEQIFYRDFSYRDMSKRGGHGTNYYGTPFTMARHLKVPTKLMEDFQSAYFQAFPCIPKWHRWCAQQLETTQRLETYFGYTRHFFGRPRDDTTLREFIACGPQSATAYRTNLVLWRIWKHMPHVQLLLQLHDGIYFQAPEELPEAEVAAQAKALARVPVEHAGRTFDVPWDIKTGWNWGLYHEHGPDCRPNCNIPVNPDGLKKLSSTPRTRRTGLDRIM